MSTTDPKPGPAVFDDRYTVTASASVTLTAVEYLPVGTVVYIAVIGRKLSFAIGQVSVSYRWSLRVVPKKG